MKNTNVYIDAHYLSLISKYFGKGKYLKFNICDFSYNISKSQNLWCEKIFYYTAPPYQSPVSTELEIELRSGYDKFITKLKKHNNITVREGRCQKIKNKFNQKGVDTLFTMDLYNVLSNSNIKNIIIVACDTDFVPILTKLKKEGYEIILFYFNDFERKSKFSMSNYILTASNKNVLLTKEDFKHSSFK